MNLFAIFPFSIFFSNFNIQYICHILRIFIHNANGMHFRDRWYVFVLSVPEIGDMCLYCLSQRSVICFCTVCPRDRWYVFVLSVPEISDMFLYCLSQRSVICFCTVCPKVFVRTGVDQFVSFHFHFHVSCIPGFVLIQVTIKAKPLLFSSRLWFRVPSTISIVALWYNKLIKKNDSFWFIWEIQAWNHAHCFKKWWCSFVITTGPTENCFPFWSGRVLSQIFRGLRVAKSLVFCGCNVWSAIACFCSHFLIYG
jgi:hypothetical protein